MVESQEKKEVEQNIVVWRRRIIAYLVVFLIIACVVVFVLLILGPVIGNILVNN